MSCHFYLLSSKYFWSFNVCCCLLSLGILWPRRLDRFWGCEAAAGTHPWQVTTTFEYPPSHVCTSYILPRSKLWLTSTQTQEIEMFCHSFSVSLLKFEKNEVNNLWFFTIPDDSCLESRLRLRFRYCCTISISCVYLYSFCDAPRIGWMDRSTVGWLQTPALDLNYKLSTLMPTATNNPPGGERGGEFANNCCSTITDVTGGMCCNIRQTSTDTNQG